MLYILTGPDQKEKDTKLTELKEKIFDGEAALFDYDVLYAKEDLSGDKDSLRKTLLTLPAMASQRLVVVRQAEKLDEYLQDMVLKWLEEDNRTTVLVLDFTVTDSRNAFYKKVAKRAKVLSESNKSEHNIFDVTGAMKRHDGAEALRLLEEMISAGQYPLQMMGGLIWFWGTCRTRLSEEKFKKGLLVIQEADLNIKRSRLDPAYALEVAVTKLLGLLNG